MGIFFIHVFHYIHLLQPHILLFILVKDSYFQKRNNNNTINYQHNLYLSLVIVILLITDDNTIQFIYYSSYYPYSHVITILFNFNEYVYNIITVFNYI